MQISKNIAVFHGEPQSLEPNMVQAEVTLFREVAINEMGWPAEELIQNIVAGQRALTHEFIAVDRGSIVGATKISVSRPYPVERPFPEITPQINADGNTVEVALTAVHKSARGDLSIMLHLYRALYHWSLAKQIKAWYSVQERQVTRLYRIIGLPFTELTEGKMYWCGISYPCRLAVSEAEKAVKAKKPELWEFFSEAPDGPL